MRTLTLFCFSLLAACAAARSAPEAASGDERIIQACIVNDASAHVPQDAVEAAMNAVAREYADRFGIAFTPHVWVSAEFAPSGWPMDVAFALRKLCPEEAEVRFVFTNRFVEPKDVSMTAKGDGGQMAGDASPYYGFVIAYSAEERWNAKDAGGGNALVGTLRHEIGHLFGLEHDQDRRSFMYGSSNASLGQWTDDAVKKIRAAKWKRWWPRS
jgi:matrixin